MLGNLEFSVLDACVAMCTRKNALEVTTGDISQYLDEQTKLRHASRPRLEKVANIIGIFALAILSQGQVDARPRAPDVNEINEAIDALEENGLIKITDISPHFCFHHDVITFSLTDAGFQYLEEVYRKANTILDNPFAHPSGR